LHTFFETEEGKRNNLITKHLLELKIGLLTLKSKNWIHNQYNKDIIDRKLFRKKIKYNSKNKII